MPSATSIGPAAERVILGALLAGDDTDYLQDAASTLAPNAFQFRPHQTVFTAVCDLFLDGVPVGLESVRQRMAERGTIADIGGYPGLTDLTLAVLTEPPRAARHYLAELADAHQSSTVATQLRTIADQMGSSLTFDEARTKTTDLMATPSMLSATVPSISEVIEEFSRDLEDRINNPGAVRGVPSGWHDLDGTGPSGRRYVGGFRAPWLIYVAARPGVGKTVALLDFIRAACKVGHGVHFASMEMSRGEIMGRLIAATAQVRLDWLMTHSHELAAHELERIENAYSVIDSWHLVIDDLSTDVPAMRRSIAASRAKFRESGAELGLVAQDYVQLIQDPPGTSSTSDQQRVSANSTRLKLLAKDMLVPVVAAAQFGRDAATQDRPPRLDDLKSSGQLEQDADLVLGLHRPYATDAAGATERGLSDIDMTAYILKFRHSSAGGQIMRDFDARYARTLEPQRRVDRSRVTDENAPPPTNADHTPFLSGEQVIPDTPPPVWDP